LKKQFYPAKKFRGKIVAPNFIPFKSILISHPIVHLFSRQAHVPALLFAWRGGGV
jgi:hypothetical protein